MIPLDVGTRWELLVDDDLVESLTNVCFQLSHPERREVAFTADAPWEDNVAGAYSLVQEDSRIRLYYRASIPDLRNEENVIVGLAESTDGGRSFSRPSIGLLEFQGSKRNNILWIGGWPWVPPAFRDTNPACRPDERYKGLTARWKAAFAMASADGIRWRLMQEKPLKKEGTFDTINTAFWDSLAGCYRSYTRFFDSVPTPADSQGEVKPKSVRAIQRSTSPDFINWTKPVPLSYRDGDPFTQLYTNSIQSCPGAEHLYIGFPNRFVEERLPVASHPYPGVNDALFMSSRDGLHWTRHLEAWVRPGLDPLNWTERNNYPSWPLIETSPTEWSVLISEHYRHPNVPPCWRRLSIRPRGFVSAHAGGEEGEFLTKPIRFSGKQLRLNFSSSAAGTLRVEIQDSGGRAIPGFAWTDMDPAFGDDLERPVHWRGQGDLSSLAGRPVRLRFYLKDADLFAFRTCP
ncbi:MAG: hypothetical protein HYU36_11540 [Planctomycetes bacterium]|nr:hypothetical protein [Planctomycetota bacterium]